MSAKIFKFAALLVVLSLCSCEFQRSQDAADAKRKMIGMSKEDVLTCMGPPKQKATVNATEVWAYNSTNAQATGYSNSHRYAGDTFSFGERTKSFCTVNIVMKNDKVAVVHYNGPTGGLLTSDEQCGYAVTHCVNGD